MIFLTAKTVDPNVFNNAVQLRSKMSEIKMRLVDRKLALEEATTETAHFSAVLNLREPLLAVGKCNSRMHCVS
jgi:hypothetical protein